jgi:hypothetical protein
MKKIFLIVLALIFLISCAPEQQQQFESQEEMESYKQQMYEERMAKEQQLPPEHQEQGVFIEEEIKPVWTEQNIAVEGKYADADVVQIDEGSYRMYFGIQPEVPGNNFEIYSATSTDGMSWTIEEGERKVGATFPDVVQNENGWRMYYQHAAEIYSAESTDGLTFENQQKIISKNEYDTVAAPSVIQLPDGAWLMVYRADDVEKYSDMMMNQRTQLFYVAHSSDGITFDQNEIFLDSKNEQFVGHVDGPELFLHEDILYLLFWTSAGRENQEDSGIYLMRSEDFGETWNDPELEVSLSSMNLQEGQVWGDPVVLIVEDTWFMYYGQREDRSGIWYATHK